MDSEARRLRMGVKSRRTIRCTSVITLSMAAVFQGHAQILPFSNNSTEATLAATGNVRGTPTIDFVRLSEGSPSVPLRYGGVVPDTEIIYFEGAQLKRGQDYQMDYASGVVYLMRAVRAGQTMRVSYRYDKGVAVPNGSATSIGAMKFDLVPGKLNFNLGLGMTERQGDGNVLSSNVFGFNNAFGFGQSSLSGLFFIGQRKKVDTQSAFEAQATPGATDVGSSQLIVQKFASKLSGGLFEANFQDISSNYTNFQAAKDSGYEVGYIDQLAKEKGMTRLGFSMTNMEVGGAKVSQSYKEVDDGKGSIKWQSYGLATGPFSLAWKQQKVDEAFKRFGDIGEADRAQLAKEAGITRDWITAAYSVKSAKLGYDQNTIEDANGVGVWRENIQFEASKFKINLTEQRIRENFTKFGNLAEAERGQWAREAGLNRKTISMDYSLFDAKSAPVHFENSILNSKAGSFGATNFTIAGKNWNARYDQIGSDSTFANIGSLAPGEMDSYIGRVGKMYGLATPVKPEDRNSFIGGSGLTRTNTSLEGEPFKGWKLAYNDIRLDGPSDEGSLNSLLLNSKNFDVSYRKQNLESRFTDVTRLMSTERQVLGSIPGLSRTDISFDYRLGGQRLLKFSDLDASVSGNGLTRTTLNYQDKKIEIAIGTRNVDAGFGVSSTLVDPEKDLLATLQGYKERDMRLKWEPFRNLKIDAFTFDANNPTIDQAKRIRNTILSWAPDKLTQIDYFDSEQRSDNPTELLYANAVERFSIARNFGKYGYLRYGTEDIEYNGTLTNLPGSHKEYSSYETKLTSATSLKTETSKTTYDNGTKEDVNTNVLSATLTKRVGVSLSDVAIDRTGSDSDERKQNYGFWWDFVEGVRFSYGIAQQQNGALNAAQEVFSIANTQGKETTMGGLSLGSATYNLNTLGDTQRQESSNVRLATSRPFQFGFLKEIKLGFGYDAASNNSNWTKENRQFSFSGKVGANSLGFEYKGQMAPTGERAIDRAFAFTTDQNDKLPIKASVYYKERTLPNGQEKDIRNISVTVRPVKGFEITNQMVTNPEIVQTNALLGSVAQASRSDKWKIDWKQRSDTTFGASYEELFNDQAHTLSRTAGVNLTLNTRSPSPISLFYGLEEVGQNGNRTKTFRYNLRFDQRPGPNQVFSFFVGNVNYAGTVAESLSKDNWSVRLDYQMRF